MDRFQSAVWPSPHLSLLIPPASEGEPGTPTPILQTSHESFREAFSFPMAQQTGGTFPAMPPREAEPPSRRFHSDPQNQQRVELPISMLMNPLPAVGPPPLNLRTCSPAAMRVQAPRNSHQPNVGLLPPSTYPRLDYTLVPSAQVWYDPSPSPASLFFGHERPPSWYLTPQTVLVHQNFSPVLNSSNTINVINVTMATQSPVETRDEQQNQQALQPHSTEGQGRPTEQVRQELRVSAESPGTSPQTVVRPEACEDSLRSPCPQCREKKEEDEHTSEAEDWGNGSFLEYLDDLCSDENFIKNTNWTNVDPDSFLNNPSCTDGNLWSLNSDPNLQQTRADVVGSENDWGAISPLLPSHLLERQDYLMNSVSPSCEGNRNKACPYCSLLRDHTSHSAGEPEQQGAVPLDLITAKGDRQQQHAISFKDCTKKSKKTHRTFTEREEVQLEQLRKQVDNIESETKPKICLTLTHCQSVPGQGKNKGTGRYEIVSPEERNQTEGGVWKMDEFTPKSRSRKDKSQNGPFSGKRLVFEWEEGDSEETNAAEQAESKEHILKLKKYTRRGGKPLSLLKAMSAILMETPSEEKRSQTPKVVKPKPKSTATERKANPPKARSKTSKRELEPASEARPLLVPSPIKRRKTEREGSERVRVSKKSTAQTSKGSGNTSSPIQPKKDRRVEGGGQKASGGSQAEERRKCKQPIKQQRSTCGRTEKSLELALDTKWSQETLQQSLETQTEGGVWKMDEFTPKSRSRNDKSQNGPFSGRRLVFEWEDGDSEETNAAEQAESKGHILKLKKYTRRGGKPLSLLKAMSAILVETPSEEKRSQTPKVVKPKPKSTATERKANPPKARSKTSKRGLEPASEAQHLLVPSPIKRRKTEREGSERVRVSKKSTAQTSKGSGNTSSLIQPKKDWRVEGGGQKASGGSQAEERRKCKQPIKQQRSSCGRTEKSLELALALDTKWSQETLQQSLETQTNDLKTEVSKPEVDRPAIKAPKPGQEAQRQGAGQVSFKGPTEKHHTRPTCGANKRDKGPNEAKAAMLRVETGQEKLEDGPVKRCRKAENQQIHKKLKSCL